MCIFCPYSIIIWVTQKIWSMLDLLSLNAACSSASKSPNSFLLLFLMIFPYALLSVLITEIPLKFSHLFFISYLCVGEVKDVFHSLGFIHRLCISEMNVLGGAIENSGKVISILPGYKRRNVSIFISSYISNFLCFFHYWFFCISFSGDSFFFCAIPSPTPACVHICLLCPISSSISLFHQYGPCFLLLSSNTPEASCAAEWIYCLMCW